MRKSEKAETLSIFSQVDDGGKPERVMLLQRLFMIGAVHKTRVQNTNGGWGDQNMIHVLNTVHSPPPLTDEKESKTEHTI